MTSLLQGSPELNQSCILLWRGMTGMSTLSGGRNSGIIVIVILGVELELRGGWCSCHDIVYVRGQADARRV